MKKVSIIYWSGTGNTEKIAEALAEGARGEDIEVKLLNVAFASKDDVLDADVVALGCPAMGDEVLEEEEMEPFIISLEGEELRRPMLLFGSYDWGDGEWMREWENRMSSCGAKLITEGFIVQNEPEEDDIEKCWALGKKLAES